MNQQTLSKAISTGILAIPAGLAWQSYFVNLVRNGREAFLARAVVRWNLFSTHQHSIGFRILEMLIVLGVIFALYELVAFCVFKVLTIKHQNVIKDHTSP